MPHFTIRDLLWLMVVVGVAVAWMVDRRQLNEQAARLKMDVHFKQSLEFDAQVLDH